MIIVEFQETKITFRIWILAVLAWFLTTVGCTLYATKKLAQYTTTIHADHLLLLEVQQKDKKEELDKELELRKQLLVVQDGLKDLKENQQQNIDKIEKLRELLAERSKIQERR